MIMFKYLFTILFLLILSFPKTAGAALTNAEAKDFTVNFQDQSFILTSDKIQNAKGTFYFPKKSAAHIPEIKKEDIINELFNKPAKKTEPEEVYNYNPAVIYNFVKDIANAVEKTPTEPSLKIQDGRALEFTAPEDGVDVDTIATSFKILGELTKNSLKADLNYSTSSPKTSLSSTNSLGINELIAQGKSNFKGSPKNRRHNIKVGVSKFEGLIIKQGEEFSFNKYLGPVEEDQGFLPELVIKASGTIPELGGGLCQVSSTTFRAAMQAGLPILQRKNHSYAVQYYAPQGTDATIYPGVIDLKFVNNTPGAILVWPHFIGNDDLVFDFYGTKDERIVELKKPYQYDRKSDGSMKAEWTRVVTKNGETSTSTFKSVYLPPALFHKEEQFVTAAPVAAPTPSPTPTPNEISSNN